MDDGVEFAQHFPEFGVEMVLDRVVRFPRDLLGNEGPLVADVVVVLDEHEFFLDSPVHLGRIGVYVVLIPDSNKGYLSRHCLALLRDSCNSSDIFLAIIDQLRMPSSSYSRRRISSYSGYQIFF